jgi:ATP-dependent protease Clp ATPase subunit
VRNLIAGLHGVRICDQCIAQCNRIVAEAESRAQPSPA